MIAEITPTVVVIGAATIDIKAHSRDRLSPTTSAPGEIRLSAGGSGRNTAENLARLGVHVALLTAVTDDDCGRQVINQTASGGVDVSRVIFTRTGRMGAYLSLVDEQNCPIGSVADLEVVAEITPQYVRRSLTWLRRCRMIVLDANLSEKTLDTVLATARKHQVPVCIDPVSVSLAGKVKPRLCDFTIITPNAEEAEALSGLPVRTVGQAARAAQALLGCGVRIVTITLGPLGLYYATWEGNGHIPAIRCDVVDPTGAGDALTAGVVFGLIHDLPVDECMRLGVSCATLAITSPETVNPELSQEKLYERMVI